MFTEDLTPFFATADFGRDANWTLQGGGSFTIQVIFDNEYLQDAAGQVEDASRMPVAWVSDAQIAQGAGMKRNDTLVIAGVTYTVAEIQPDGTGVSVIHLRK